MMKHACLLSKFNSWSALEQEIARLPDPKQRGDAFEEFCYFYLKLRPEYQIKDIWLQGQFPSRIIEALKLSGQKDQGIDLVAETNSGKLWAIQAKFRSDRKDTVSYKELSTFLAVSDRADYRLIISNTEQLPEIIGKRSRCGEALIDRLNILDTQYFNRLRQSIETEKPAEIKVLSPKQHQEIAISKAIEHFKTNDRGQLIMACGSGKTLTAVWIAEQLQSKKILVMVPSLALMRQTVSVWADNFKARALNYMCICSDTSVAEDAKSDRPVGHLWEMDIPVTTNSEEARQFLTENSEKPLIVFSTYQSSDVLSKTVSELPGFSFDLAICDEAHRTAGTTQSLFNLVLDDKRIPSRKRLFMTATPRILDKHIMKKGEEEDVELFSMADETKYGKEFHRLSFGEAIKLKLLCDYKVIVAVVSDEEVRRIISSRNNVQIQSEKTFEREAESLAKQIAFIKAVTQYAIKHTISFHSRVSYAQSFSDSKSDNGIGAVNIIMKNYATDTPLIDAFHVNGTVPSGQRSSIISEFANSSYSVISNARCLTEGVDIPSVDGVMFYDPKYRLTDIVQATGRALRLFEGKQSGYLIIPVFLRESESADDILESSDFSQVWSVIKAMQSQDERLDEVIKMLRVMDGQIAGGDEKLSGERKSLEEKLNEWLTVQGLPNKISHEQFIKKIDIKLLNELGSSWDYQFGLLKAFRVKHPDRWPSAKKEKLGQWIVTQRTLYNKNKLTQNRIDLLNKIKFQWDPLDEYWTTQYSALTHFRKQNPDRWPNQKEKSQNNKLYNWCIAQRMLFSQNKLSKNRVTLLDKIGFQWNQDEEAWVQNYKNLIEFRKLHPASWPEILDSSPDKNKLSIWCNNQRVSFKKDKLSQDRIDLLNKIRFRFGVIDFWTPMYEQLIKFRELNPDRWPARDEEFQKGSKLGLWCSNQRVSFKKGKLSQNQIALLNKIGFRWEQEDAWLLQYENLLQFRKQNPDRWPIATEEFPEKNKLGMWCSSLRALCKMEKLPQDRIDSLNKIGFQWDPLSESWVTQYKHLIQFRKQNPDRWPTATEQFPNGNNLGQWCNNLRSMYKIGKLSQDRINLLNNIDFLWDKFGLAWKKQYEFLTIFRKQNPDRWPTATKQFPEGNNLGQWCANQRQDFKRGELPQDRKDLLNKIGFPWGTNQTKK